MSGDLVQRPNGTWEIPGYGTYLTRDRAERALERIRTVGTAAFVRHPRVEQRDRFGEMERLVKGGGDRLGKGTQGVHTKYVRGAR